MEKYRKKPISVQGFQWDGTLEMLKTEIPETSWNDFFILDAHKSVTIEAITNGESLCLIQMYNKNAVIIRTFQGWQVCLTGNYIVQSQDSKGQTTYYSLKPNEFKQQYDLIQ